MRRPLAVRAAVIVRTIELWLFLRRDGTIPSSSEVGIQERDRASIATCEDCRQVLEEARPSKEVLEPLMEEVRLLAVQVTARAKSASTGGINREQFLPRTADRAKLFR